MNSIDIIYDQTLHPLQDRIRAQVEQGDLYINQIEPGNCLALGQHAHPCLHIFAHPYGLSNTEHKELCIQLEFRFRAAELALNAHSIYTQILVGMAHGTIHIFIPNNEVLLTNLGFIINQLVSIPPIPQCSPAVHLESTTNATPDPTAAPSAQSEKSPTAKAQQISLSQIADTTQETALSVWESILNEMGGSIDATAWTEITPELQRIAPVRNVLEQAGERKICRFQNGQNYTLYGYPNLEQRNAKVLLVGAIHGKIEIIALHRAPNKVGVVSSQGCGWLPQKNLEDLSKEYTGAKAPQTESTIFAVDSRSIYYESSGTVFHWDGKRERNFGTPNQTLASLILQWSQR